MQAYVILVSSKNGYGEVSHRVSREGYKSYDDALNYIKSMSGFPDSFEVINPYNTKLECEFLDVENDIRYLIVDVVIK